jgi:secreted trypsin-like serine protease
MLLQQVELTVTYHFTADGYFIANGIGMQGICFGDSGGPFVVRIGNDWHLAGVSSFGGCTPGGGFARVTESTTATWIKRQLHPIDTFPIMDLPVRMYVPLVSR